MDKCFPFFVGSPKGAGPGETATPPLGVRSDDALASPEGSDPTAGPPTGRRGFTDFRIAADKGSPGC